MANRWSEVAIIGVGLIGGSIGLALKQRGLADRIVGVGRNVTRLKQAQQRGAIDRAETDLIAGTANCELCIICTPVDTIADFVGRIAEHREPSMLITDVGSTKTRIVQQIAHDARHDAACFIGSHPLAGSQRTGVAHASADLFEGRVVITTPSASAPETMVQRLHDFWTSLGANVEAMTPESHDAALAITSHLPHAIASALAAVTPSDYLRLCATGWSDTTRIAAGDVDLWQQIFRHNRQSVVAALDRFLQKLEQVRAAIDADDQLALQDYLEQGKRNRDAVAD